MDSDANRARDFKLRYPYLVLEEVSPSEMQQLVSISLGGPSLSEDKGLLELDLVLVESEDISVSSPDSGGFGKRTLSYQGFGKV